ncbi:MAG: hypothetical protein AAGE84_28125 [Cyanobacteria bacterium P01_G01_bin.39]
MKNFFNSLFINFRRGISNSYFQGLVALVGLIATIASDNLWVRIPAILVLLSLLFTLRSSLFSWVEMVFTWLTWKFVLGLIIGLIAAAILAPALEPIYRHSASLILPQVEVVDTTPKDGDELSDSYEGVEVKFSHLIPSKYRWLIKTEIIPQIEIKRKWLYIIDPQECCRTLYIKSQKYFPDGGPMFEPNKVYHLTIKGLMLKHPKDIEFRTPSR